MDRDATELKPAINNLLWMHSPGDLTLAEAELRAVKIMEIILAERNASYTHAE